MDIERSHNRFLALTTKEEYNEMFDLMCKHLLVERRDFTSVDKVIFNPPATIICWGDGSKSVVKAQNGEPYDPEKGFVMAYLKKLLGNDNTFNKEISKWVKYEEPRTKPLTIKQIRKMDGEKLWVVSLDGDKNEKVDDDDNGWHIVNVKEAKLIDKDGSYYFIEDENTECGFHAYLEPPKECFG